MPERPRQSLASSHGRDRPSCRPRDDGAPCDPANMRHAYKTMALYHTYFQIHRGGKQFRVNPERFFYIKRVGWFVHTRGDLEICDGLELFDGIIGPFSTRARARFNLLKLIYQEQPELFLDNPLIFYKAPKA